MKLNTEEWKDVPGYEGLYQVSSHGQVRSLDHYGKRGKGMAWRRGKTLKQCVGQTGYCVVGLSKHGEMKQHSVHSLVMLAFVGPRPDGQDICHGDGDRANNCLSNLRYDSRVANAADKRMHGTNNDGDTNPRAKLTNEDVMMIFNRCNSGESQLKVAEELGLSCVTVNHIVTGRTWGSVTGRKWARRHVVVTPVIVRKIHSLQEQGLSLNEIADTLHISKATAFRYSKNKREGLSTIEGAMVV